MELGTVSDVIVALAAVAALALSIYNYRFQKDEARLRREEIQEEARRRHEEMLPSLQVSSDTRMASELGRMIYSCRVVNNGHVPVEIRSLRIVVSDGRTLPMPATDEEMEPHLWENERTVPVNPTVLQQGHSVRFATSEDRMNATLRNAGFAGWTDYEVAVVDALDNSYTTEETALLGRPNPEP